jgi:hypothetical protein
MAESFESNNSPTPKGTNTTLQDLKASIADMKNRVVNGSSPGKLTDSFASLKTPEARMKRGKENLQLDIVRSSAKQVIDFATRAKSGTKSTGKQRPVEITPEVVVEIIR